MKSSTAVSPSPYSIWESSIARTIFRLVFYSPWAWLALFGIFVLTVTLQVGHLPVYGQPDPKYAGSVSLLQVPIMLLLIWVLGTTPIGIVVTGIRLWKGAPKSVRWAEPAFYLGGVLLFYGFVLSNMAGLMTWFMD